MLGWGFAGAASTGLGRPDDNCPPCLERGEAEQAMRPTAHHAAKGIVLQIRVVELAVDDLEARASPRCEIFVSRLRRFEINRAWRPMSEKVARKRLDSP